MSKRLTSNKILVVVVILLVAGMVAMFYPAIAANTTNDTVDPIADATPDTTIDTIPTNPAINTAEGPPGITPGKVFVEGLTLGVEAKYILTICNNSHNATSFSVGYRYPDFVADGYAKPSSDAPGWLHISDTLPTVPAHSTKNIEIVLLVPSGAEVPGKFWEFWIGVIDQGQTGMVQVELCQRWQITMR